MTTEIRLIEAEVVEQLSPATVNDLQSNFNPLFEKAKGWKEVAEKLIVTDVSQTNLMKQARLARLELKNIRVETEKVRKTLKEESLLKGKAIDGMANIIKFLIVPLESHLEQQEKFAEIQEEKRLDDLEQVRGEQLSKYLDDLSGYNLRVISEGAYQSLLADQKRMHELRIEEERRAEEERSRREQEQAEERERIRLENEKLRKEAQEREALIKKEREANEKKLEEERAKAAAERQRIEFDQKTRLEAERREREKLEAELKEKKLAEETALKEVEERKVAESERLKALELAPDKDKLKSLAINILNIEYPEVKNEEARVILDNVKVLIQKVNVYIIKNIESI